MDSSNAQIKAKAQKLIDSKPADPAKLPEWWASWHALGDMVTTSSTSGLSAEQEDEAAASSNANAHWKGWWNSQGPPELPGGPETAQKKSKIVVWGGGAFGTAMATCAARNGHDVVMYVRDQAQADSINNFHKNSKYLTDFDLLPNITASTDLKTANENASLFMHCLPCQLTPKWLETNRDIIPENVCICSTAKGLYVETRQLLGDAMLAALKRPQPLAFLSGPSFAAEIMKGDPTAVVVASEKLYHASAVQKYLSCECMRIYVTQDVVGVQLGGALKNPLAIGAGMIEGMGLGINTMSAFVARSCNELNQLCIAMGGDAHTISGLSGVGDLMLTAFGNLSRNRTCGMRLVKGESLSEILASTTVEGVPTAGVAVYYADRCGLDLPIFRTAFDVINGRLTAKEARAALMNRPLGKE
ncbi:hypothetical protein TrVE_jg11727 [Triparma verrucosa]|uniref:Glycerol-3-phosphate dehydrogenase [NAD(+)] n=1 Tax=Triparma verrucosa TaxID=1606542 RepID=A0A9W7BM58_9STRA|nr:hypothetical protein TrVE_jg11727 [Triparma verrucosa]